MSFWNYCEEVSKLIGSTYVRQNIKKVYHDYKNNKDPEECCIEIPIVPQLKIYREPNALYQ